uniref:Uncharacterized protein n=1 Tax=viral metagenome TaxID=1070528 RepID=A0A6M3II41_9ZZZZ
MSNDEHQDTMRINHLNTTIRVNINGEVREIDEATQRETFREIENEYYNCKYRVKAIVDRLK